MFFPFFDPTFIILIPALIFTFYAQSKVQTTFEKYSKIGSMNNLTGAQLARMILNNADLDNIEVEEVKGHLTDHYDPKNKKLRLSTKVFNSTSLAALGVAAHEAGHAIQDDKGYLPLHLRMSFTPLAQLGSTLAMPLFFIGLIFSAPSLLKFGILAFTMVVLFQLITLPVEFNASNRALAILANGNYLTSQEIEPARKVLNAAALTYLAGALVAVTTLVRFLILAGLSRE
ncbi:MAG: zinc metallopeptidase [Bacillota bacterium]